LFWALRGGGGGTYGVVTSTTYKTYPTLSLTSAVLTTKFTSPDIAQNVITEYIKFHPLFSDAGWTSYVDLSKSSFSANLIALNTSWADASLAFFSFVQYVEEATGGQVQLDITPFASFYEYFLATTANNERTTGTQVEMASRLLPRSLAENDPAKVAEILLSLGEHGVHMV
jgi:FAD/FMN-containing dehydrogenase